MKTITIKNDKAGPDKCPHTAPRILTLTQPTLLYLVLLPNDDNILSLDIAFKPPTQFILKKSLPKYVL